MRRELVLYIWSDLLQGCVYFPSVMTASIFILPAQVGDVVVLGECVY